MTSGQSCINKLISSWPDQIRPCDASIKLHRNFRNLYFQVSFSQNFQLAASLFYSIIRNFSYFRPKGCCCFYPVSCVFLLHMGLLITTYANLVNVWKTSGEGGDQWVKYSLQAGHWFGSYSEIINWGQFFSSFISTKVWVLTPKGWNKCPIPSFSLITHINNFLCFLL